MTEAEAPQKSFEWKWMIIGTIVGVLLAVLLVYIMSETFHTYYVPTFIGLLSFIITGIIIGYKSPGYTLREPAVGGALAIIITLALVHYGFQYTPPVTQMVLAPVIGFFFALIGGWVGEELQGSATRAAEKKSIAGLEWAWIITGAIIGFILSNVFVFGFFALFHFGVSGILTSLGLSFVCTGIIVGYKSPGVTIKEAAIAGVLGVILNFLLVYYGFGADDIPVAYMAIGLAGGFILSLIGGWLGEVMQKMAEKQKPA